MMNFRFLHTNLNVLDMDKSLAFYQRALGLAVASRVEFKDGSATLVYLTDAAGSHQLELTHLAGRKEPYDLSDNEIHIAFEPEDFEAAHKLHQEMGCICQDVGGNSFYFIEDPDGYWLEICRKK